MNAPSFNTQNIYEIKIQGQMDASWMDWMETVNVQTQLHDNNQSITILSNLITDQSGLVGLVRRLHGMGIILISIQLLELTSSGVKDIENADER